ncbi:unnamed protein product [Adineta steineri]|uniref:Hermes trasposase DNA-binding domain-containing protein n=1 Tax=Adineta steineri TaxID=433720 RepID=A0A813T4Q0_9BILA|nr:unnamed protein product [Adineta steineri]
MNTYLYNRLSGSKCLKQHADKCFSLVTATTSSSSITFSSSKHTPLNNMVFTKDVKITEGDVAKIKDLSVKWICSDIRSFSILDDSDFRNLTQEFVRLGAVYETFDINDASRADINIVCDRGSNFDEKKKIKVTAGCARDKLYTEQTTIAVSTKNRSHESSDDDSESSTDDEYHHATALPIIKQKKFHSRKTVITRDELSVSLAKMITDQIPLCAKQVLEALKKCKKIVKYVKKAGINNDMKEDSDGTLNQSCVVRRLLVLGIRWFRECLLKLIDEFCVLDVRHYYATMLHPKYGLLKNRSQEKLSQCHKYVREQLKIIRNAQSTPETLQQTADPHPERFKTADSIFARFENDYSHGSRENNVECFEYESDEYDLSGKQSNELDRYLLMQIDKLSVTDNSLDFGNFIQIYVHYYQNYCRRQIKMNADIF